MLAVTLSMWVVPEEGGLITQLADVVPTGTRRLTVMILVLVFVFPMVGTRTGCMDRIPDAHDEDHKDAMMM